MLSIHVFGGMPIVSLLLQPVLAQNRAAGPRLNAFENINQKSKIPMLSRRRRMWCRTSYPFWNGVWVGFLIRVATEDEREMN